MSDMKPLCYKVKSKEELQDDLMKELVSIANYWNEHGENKIDAVEGAIFSTLALFDSGSLNLPSFIVAPISSEYNLQYQYDRGEKTTAINEPADVKCDIGGELHSMFINYNKH